MRYAICGNYGAGNYGDELILKGLLKFIKEADSRADFVILSANPIETEDNYKVYSVLPFPAGLRSFLKKNKATEKAVKAADFFILGGGGLFGSLTFRANIIWGIQAYMALKFKKRLLIMGQSIGELKGFIRKMIVKYVFKRAEYICVRDYKSKQRLEDLGIKNIHVFPDFAYQEVEKVDKEKELISVALAASSINKFPNISQKLEEYSKKHKIKLIAFKKPEDEELNRKLNYPLGDIDDFKRSEKAITMRLHSMIMAINYCIPCLPLNYAEKIKDQLEYLNIPLTQDFVSIEDIKKAQQFIKKEKEKSLQTFQTFLNL